MNPSAGGVSRGLQVLVIAMAVGAAVFWLLPAKANHRRSLKPTESSRADTPSPAASGGASENQAKISGKVSEKAMSDSAILNLLDEYLDPEDPDLPPGRAGTNSQTLSDEPVARIQQVLERAPKLIGRGFDARRQWSSLGRVALVSGDKERAFGYLRDANKLGSASGQAYLSQLLTKPIEQFQMLNLAIRGGFKPAIIMMQELEKESVEKLDEAFLHPDEPDKPLGKLGIKDSALAEMRPKELQEFITSYGEWVKTKPEIPRLAFGIGRAALWAEDNKLSRDLLEFAAVNGSAGAHAYLSRHPDYADHYDLKLEHLKIAVAGGFQYAKPWLDTVEKVSFDPAAFQERSLLLTLYEGKVDQLLNGQIGIETVPFPTESKKIFRRAMTMDYCAAFAKFIESEEPGFLGDITATWGINKSGTAGTAEIALAESAEGVAYSSKLGGAAMSIEQIATKRDIGMLGKMLFGSDEINGSLEKRRETIREIAKQDSRRLWNMKKEGNAEPLKRVYSSIIIYVARFKGTALIR